jgi:hypothetical protein
MGDDMSIYFITVEYPGDNFRDWLGSAEKKAIVEVEADGLRIVRGPILLKQEQYPGRLQYLFAFVVVDDEGDEGRKIMYENAIFRLVVIEYQECDVEGGLRGGLDSAKEDATRRIEAEGFRVVQGPSVFNWQWLPGKLQYTIGFMVVDEENGVE